jgi:hypothetical protein
MGGRGVVVLGGGGVDCRPSGHWLKGDSVGIDVAWRTGTTRALGDL